jgi:hypothetical protein
LIIRSNRNTNHTMVYPHYIFLNLSPTSLTSPFFSLLHTPTHPPPPATMKPQPIFIFIMLFLKKNTQKIKIKDSKKILHVLTIKKHAFYGTNYQNQSS